MIASKEWGELIGVEATGRFYILASYRYAADELSKDGHCLETPLRPCVKLENNNAKMQRRDGAKNKSLRVYFTGIFGCAVKI